MKETELRIQKYKAMLPRARERVIAALMIFVFSIAMLTVSTFSWITLSVAPEVSGATTTIAANGNLEIALARDILLKEDGTPMIDEDGNVIAIPPSASAIGDSLLPIQQKNLTWGNIVNLSDASYGLENITLRPATLNTIDLLSKPLKSVKYGVDGRVVDYDSDYRYVQYDTQKGEFIQSDYKGVKAISSIGYTEVEIPPDAALDFLYETTLANADVKADTANAAFHELNVNGAYGKYMEAVGGLLSTYADGLLSDATKYCDPDDVAGFYNMLVYLDEEVLVPVCESLMEILNVYLINTYGSDKYKDYTFKNVDEFITDISKIWNDMNDKRYDTEGLERVSAGTANLSATATVLNAALADDDEFNALFPFIADIKEVRKHIATMESSGYVTIDANGEAAGSTSVTWANIEKIVDYLVTVEGDNGIELTKGSTSGTIQWWFDNLKSQITTLAGMLSGSPGDTSKGVSVTIRSGLIERIDKLLYGQSKGPLSIDYVTIKLPVDTLKAKAEEMVGSFAASMAMGIIPSSNGFTYLNAGLTTDANKDTTTSVYIQDRRNAKEASGAQEVQRDWVAQDTYGLSVDFWLRTNAASSYLTLEGELVYKDSPVYVTVDGTKYQVYEAELTYAAETDGEEDIVMDAKVYQIEGVYYNYETQSEIDATATVEVGAALQTREIAGYVGANRIWTEEELATMSEIEYRTTQGSGSCYTFYADPGEVGAILDVLKALKVAFVDSNGNLLATASLATEYCFPEYGKYVVPLMLDENAIDTGNTTDNGDVIRAVMSLEQNQATLITALVYLDGTVVTNDKVLSSSDIQGQLNIQFGSTKDPEPLDDEDLMSETLKITAKVTDAQGKENPEFYFTDEDKSFTTNVELTVEGDAPTTITANFLRKITTTQGTRGETITFVQDASDPTKWTATATFTAPGEYILRSVFADGIERKLTNVVDTGNAEADKAESVKVTVHGFSISGLSTDKGINYTYMTAADYVTESFSVNINRYDSANGTLTPSSVKAVFTNENNVAVTVNFTSAGSGKYTGTATFVSDGTYTLENIIVDGLYYPLDAVYTREVYTNLSVAVWLTHDEGVCELPDPEKVVTKDANGNYSYVFENENHDFKVNMKVYDSKGKEITDLYRAELYYSGTGTKFAKLEWSTDLGGTWVGDITIDSPGKYEFSRAVVYRTADAGGETINKKSSATAITVMSKDPVEYKSAEILDKKIVIGASTTPAYAIVNFNYAESATVYGVFTHTLEGAETTYLLSGSKVTGSDNSYAFEIPKMDGYWELTEVLLTGVSLKESDKEQLTFFSADPINDAISEGELVLNNAVNGYGYTEINAEALDGYKSTDGKANYAVITSDDFGGTNGTGTKVIATVDAEYSGGISEAESVFQGKMFMEAYEVIKNNQITVNIVDFAGEPIENIVDYVRLNLTYISGTSQTHGGYTSDGGQPTQEVVAFTASNNNSTFTSTAINLAYAGEYKVSLVYSDDGETEKSLDMPDNWKNTIVVKTETPSVKITAISNKDTSISVDNTTAEKTEDTYTTSKASWGRKKYSFKINGAHSSATPNISANGLKATVYFRCFHDGTSTYNNTGYSPEYKYHTYVTDDGYGVPQVTLNLSNIGSFDSAELSFSDNSRIYSGVTYTGSGLDPNGVWETTGSGTKYTWTKAGDSAALYIGYAKSQKARLNDEPNATGTKIPAGTITADTLTVVYEGVTYTFTIPTITINNPY